MFNNYRPGRIVLRPKELLSLFVSLENSTCNLFPIPHQTSKFFDFENMEYYIYYHFEVIEFVFRFFNDL